MTEHDEQEDEWEPGFRDYLEELGLRQAELIQREIHRVVREAIETLREELAAEREKRAAETAAYFRKAMRRLDTEKVED